MGFFNINFNTLVQQLIPPLLRNVNELAWLKALSKPLQYNNDNFITYISGSTLNPYNNASAYTSGDTVVYTNLSVYSSITGSTSGITPTDTNYWFKLNDIYIGAEERAHYNAQKYLYEYALNRWFMVSGTTTASTYGQAYNNIYIQTNLVTTTNFMMGQTGPYSSNLSNTGTYASNFMGNLFNTPNINEYTIWFPNYIYTANTQSYIRSFCDTVNISGMMYSLSGY